MLSTLTSYLVQYKKVHIPDIGTFELLYKPAVLDFADRLIYPPSREVVFISEGSTSMEQVEYLGSVLQLDKESIEVKQHQDPANQYRVRPARPCPVADIGNIA